MKNADIEIYSYSELMGKSYGVDYTSLNFGDAPLHGMIGQLDPGTTSRIHNHYETEIFIFLSGNGVVHVDGVKIDVTPGMGVKAPAFSNHYIENTHTDILKFMSFYWCDNVSDLQLTHHENKEKTLIFSAPPTPNGDLHLGHLSGPYIAADIYKRYLQQCSYTAFHATGRDDHQTYVYRKAMHDNLAPAALADLYSDAIRKTLHQSDVTIDYYHNPQMQNGYKEFIRDLFNTLYQNGYIVEKDEMATFSSVDDRYLHEAYISGICPFCQRNSDGNACEECGRPNACVDLINAYEKQTNQPPSIKPCTRLYFRLSQFAHQLDEYIKTTPMSAHAFTLSQHMLADGLPDICVSHPGEWGISIPVPGFEDQRIYVWFELALSYLWSANQINHEFYTDNENQVVHFIGFDNAYYHTILFPAIYFALGLKKQPHAYVVNELLDLNGSKFSTSRNHAVWTKDILKVVSVDYMRWVLCEVRPEGKRSDFTLSQFTSVINQIFPGILKTWISQLSRILNSNFNNIIPESGAWISEQKQFLNLILSYRENVITHYKIESFSPRNITAILNNLAKAACDFTRTQSILTEHHSTRDYLRTSVALSVLALKIFALLARPVTPHIATQILSALNISDDILLTDTGFVAAETEFNPSYLPDLTYLTEEDFNMAHANISRNVA